MEPLSARGRFGGALAARAVTSTSAIAAINLALSTTGRASTVVIFGLPGDNDVHELPAIDSMLMDKTIRYSWLAPNTWPEAIDLIATGKVKVVPVQSFEFGIDELGESIRKVRDREDNAIKPLRGTNGV